MCLIMCCICFFIVNPNNIMKYSNRIGQNTGMLKSGKKVITNAIKSALMEDILGTQHAHWQWSAGVAYGDAISAYRYTTECDIWQEDGNVCPNWNKRNREDSDQNLNSGTRRWNGLNSASDLSVGRLVPSSSSSGSICLGNEVPH